MLLWKLVALSMYLHVEQFFVHGWHPGFGGGFCGPIFGRVDFTRMSRRFLGRQYATMGFFCCGKVIGLGLQELLASVRG